MIRMALCIVLVFTGAARGQTPPAGTAAPGKADPAARIDEIARTAMSASPRLVGMSIGVSYHGEVIFAKGYGLANLEHEVPASAETVYHLDSIGKNITAAAVLRLVDAGKLRLDDDLGKYVPAFAGRGVLVRHLLNHTSGIKDFSSMPAFAKQERLDLGHEAVIALFEHEPADFAPGMSWRYDNSAFYLLGLVIEKASGTDYFDFVRRTFFDRLEMHATVYGLAKPIVKHRAQGYVVEHGEPVNADAMSWVPVFSAGAWCSTVLDMLRWQDALEHGRVVSRESLQAMRAPTAMPDGVRIDYGFGTRMGEISGHRCYGHTGTGGGFNNVMLSFPDDQLAIVVLKNSEGNLTARTVAARIARAILNLPAPPIKDLPLSQEELDRFTGTFQGEELIESFARGDRMWARPPGAAGTEIEMRYQGNGIFALGEESFVRFWPGAGKATWGFEYDGGLLLGVDRRVP